MYRVEMRPWAFLNPATLRPGMVDAVEFAAMYLGCQFMVPRDENAWIAAWPVAMTMSESAPDCFSACICDATEGSVTA